MVQKKHSNNSTAKTGQGMHVNPITYGSSKVISLSAKQKINYML